MLKRTMRFILILAVVIGLAACEGNARALSEQPAAAPVAAPAIAIPKPEIKTPLEMSVREKEHPLAMYEPADGCYLGAYILSNRRVSYDIGEFEKLATSPHGLYMYNMRLGDTYPTNWVLGCIAKMKTPYVTLKTELLPVESDWEALSLLAESFAVFDVPMFLEFNSLSMQNDADIYIEVYQKARIIFKEKAPNVAFVWSVPSELAGACEAYYPGDDFVDWVGLELFETLDQKDSGKLDPIRKLDAFYLLFQRRKPIMLTRLGISHRNTGDFVYQSDYAAAEIARIYGLLAKDYPRVKAVFIMDFDGIRLLGTGRKTKDDFTITTEEKILAAYNAATANPWFICRLEAPKDGETARTRFRSAFTAYAIDGVIYVSEDSLRTDTNVSSFGRLPAKDIGGRRFVAVSGDDELMQLLSFKEIPKEE